MSTHDRAGTAVPAHHPLPRRRGARDIVILSHPDDVHADAVEEKLTEAGVIVHRLDTPGMGTTMPISAYVRHGVLEGRLGPVDIARVGCVWHRRPSEFAVTDPIDAAEVRAAVGGVLASLPYLNHPADMALAKLKPYQLATAARCGLRVPDTVITSQWQIADAFQQQHGQVVVKPMSRQAARFVTPEDRNGWRRPVHLTQQSVDKRYDVRLTVVDDHLFAVAVHSPEFDWRVDGDRSYTLVDVPTDVAGGVDRMMRVLRLRYGAWDFSVDQQGNWWVLEVNPNGQWLWLDQELGVGITDAVATALTGR